MLLETSSIQIPGYALMDNVQNMLLSGNVKEGIDHLMLGMRKIRNHYSTSQWQEFSQTTFLKHPATQLIHQCPLTYHSFTKPRGYAGDAELLDYIYGFKEPSPSVSALGQEICEYWRNLTLPSSARLRLEVLAKTIDYVACEASHPVQILSIACGHLREAKQSIAIREESIAKLIAFDQDSLSLEVINRELPKDFIQTIQGSVTKLIRQKQTFKNLDLVYASGLYDYLSQKFATRLTKFMFDMLRSGGKLLVPNVVPDHPQVDYLETFMQWHLIYRGESQLEDVAKDIPTSHIANKRIFLEDNGNIIFLELTKA